MGQLAVLLKGIGPEINRAVLCHICVPLINQGLDHLQHPADFLGCLGMYRGGLDIHGRHVLFALLNIAL